MEQEDDLRSRFALPGENTGLDVDEGGPLTDGEEDEDENTRHVTELEKERCPNCYSSFLEPYTTKDGLNVLRCKGCGSLLCPRCTNMLQKAKAPDGRKTLRCPKCGLLS
jgi:uncharacterized C2H2 Zn-finger protein